MDKNYRIHTNIATDTVLNVNMQQDYDFLEVLTMKLRQKDAYRLHSSNYGVIIGRVLANDAFGIPNARISVFIERDTDDPVDIENIYPYSEVTSKDKDGRRYNLLPDYSDDDCYRIVGTFPNKRLLLDNDIEVEIYEKYWKYTTVTNNAGDYMIFGVPSGSQQIHVDIDLSDIGILSQKPRDFEYKGYNITMFDNPNQFKESTNLDGLAQLFSQDKSVFVYPFWGDADNGIAAITRCDVQIQYKFEPTCVFMGSIVSDNEGNTIGHKCEPAIDNGMNNQLIAGEGTIEMIRKTQDGLVEEYQIQGNQLIDSDGVWCYQIPMNLDFIGTDEYGNIVPTDNPNKGIPTRTQVRFRISKHDTGDEGFSTHTAKYLVPMNPIFSEKESITSKESENGILDGVQPVIENTGEDIENMYMFGSSTPQSCFRDLYWNNVYSVKNYIPKTQIAHRPFSKNYSALKGSNLSEDKNPIPFNKLRVDLPFLYVIVCILFDILTFIVSVINTVIVCGINLIIGLINELADLPLPLGFTTIHPFGFLHTDYIACITLGEGLSDNTIYAPGCGCGNGQDAIDNPEGAEISTNTDELKDLVVERLAEDFKIIKLDFYQDWLNGALYMPLWYWRKRKKKTYLFGLITRSAKNQYCDCNEEYKRLRTYVTCNVKYENNSLGTNDTNVPERNDWHRKMSDRVSYAHGLIKSVTNKDGLTAYYYASTEATRDNINETKLMSKRTEPFYAIRLYATDIILLGNLNEDNLYGIPQFFKVLPSTTANIPQIATIQENEKMTPEAETAFDEGEKANDDNEIYTEEESGRTITTGMNWRHYGNNPDEPGYSWGLFMELACTEVITKGKSCFNVERLSELGVNLDMSYNMPYTIGNMNSIQYGRIYPDGFINKLELDDMESRAMFATMNHIGFVPQPYQDSISGYTTQIEDEHTRYLIPKFRYIYPVDFDGRQIPLMKRYYNSRFGQHMFDEIDESYLTFRFGADATSDENVGEKNRIRHFYHVNDDGYSMPVYNNSFYFYFGINKGNTAIDKFNKMFYSECFKNDKAPFTFTIDVRGKAYCSDIYSEDKKEKSFGYIKFESDDIQTPYSYTLYDSLDNVIIHEDGIETDKVVIGGKIDDGEVKCNNFGAVLYQSNTLSAICSGDTGYIDCSYNPQQESTTTPYFKLINGTYVLNVTDFNGKTLSEEIKLVAPSISFAYETIDLGTEFYNTELSRIDYICDNYNKFYGILRVTSFAIDGDDFKITNATCITNNNITYTICATGTASTSSGEALYGNKNVVMVFRLSTKSEEEVNNVHKCMCHKNNGVPNSENIDVYGNGGIPFKFDAEKGTFEFAVYRPFVYNMSMTLKCGEVEVPESTIVQNISIGNGEEFDARLNEMPVRFMLGTVSDGTTNQIANTSNFYRSTAVTTPNGDGLKGWYGAHREDTYKFNLYPTTEDGDLTWSKYVSYNNINQVEDRKKILRYKFDKMFNLSNTVYVSSNSQSEFIYDANGGVHPTLYRVHYPEYSTSNLGNYWIYSDRHHATNDKSTPNIVGSNYWWDVAKDRSTGTSPSTSPSFNGMFRSSTDYVGNYFAAFTNNGRYISSFSGNCSLSTIQIPTHAAVNLTDYWKPLDDDIQTGSVLTRVHTAGQATRPCAEHTEPYIRAMFIDRKLDYDFIIWTPNAYQLDLYGKDNNDNKFLNNSRISGITYNGIEMSYDWSYNIISATTNADEGSINKNSRLEYSYSASSNSTEDAITFYNVPSDTNTVWRENAVGNTKQVLKTLYKASINNFDIRNYFWSAFNITNLSAKVGYNGPSEEYIFDHSDDVGRLYNDDFSVTNYPTKRLIDIGNIGGDGMFNLSLTSCSYRMSPTIKSDELQEDNVIISKTTAGKDSVKVQIYPQDVIKFVNPDDGNEEYANIIFKTNGAAAGSYANFYASVGNIAFKYNQSLNGSDFSIYPRFPRLIKITPFGGNSDGITYIKRADDDLDDRITAITIHCFNRIWKLTNPTGTIYVDDYSEVGDFGADETYGNWGPYFIYDDSKVGRLTLKNVELTRITMKKNNFDLSQIKLFGLLNSMDYYGKDKNRKNHIRTVEVSHIFDSRDVKLMIYDAYVNVTETKAKTTIDSIEGSSNIDLDSSHMTVNVPGQENPIEVNVENPPTNSITNATGEGGTDVQSFYQVVIFRIKRGDINLNQAFVSVGNMMGSVFVFKSGYKTLTLTPEVNDNNADFIELKVSFNVGDGIFADNEWKGKTEVYLLLEINGFRYKLPFKLNSNITQDDYDDVNNRFDNVGSGLNRKQTNQVQIITA